MIAPEDKDLLPGLAEFPTRYGKHLTLSARAKALLLAGFLSIPCAWLAVSIADNTHVPDWLRYVFSPGTRLASLLVMGPTHALQQMLEQLSHWTVIALLTNMVFYGMLIFGFAMVFSARKRSN
jgi:hypothetical protein